MVGSCKRALTPFNSLLIQDRWRAREQKGNDLDNRRCCRNDKKTGWQPNIGDPEITASPAIDTEFRACRPNVILGRFNVTLETQKIFIIHILVAHLLLFV